jgi:hypothetical protein
MIGVKPCENTQDNEWLRFCSPGCINEFDECAEAFFLKQNHDESAAQTVSSDNGGSMHDDHTCNDGVHCGSDDEGGSLSIIYMSM